METLAIISIITSICTLLTVFSKTIKKSTCLGCLRCETRTPDPSVIVEHHQTEHHTTPHTTPRNSPQIVKKEPVKELYV